MMGVPCSAAPFFHPSIHRNTNGGTLSNSRYNLVHSLIVRFVQKWPSYLFAIWRGISQQCKSCLQLRTLKSRQWCKLHVHKLSQHSIERCLLGVICIPRIRFAQGMSTLASIINQRAEKTIKINEPQCLCVEACCRALSMRPCILLDSLQSREPSSLRPKCILAASAGFLAVIPFSHCVQTRFKFWPAFCTVTILQ
jgi:hypothetical protein